MLEIDFNTEEGKEELKKYIYEIVNKEDKTELCELLNSMFSLIINHEVKFENLKNI
jgi:hypothetical protein